MVTLSRISVSLALLSIVSFSFARPPQPTKLVVVHAVNMGACNFRIADPFGGRIRGDPSDEAPVYATYLVELPRKTLPATFHIRLGCDTRDPVQVCREFAGANHTPQGWVEWYTPDQGPAPKADRVVVRELRSLNGAGAVQLQNMPESVIGPANRSLGFCLTAPNGATLWGGVIVDEFSGRHKSVEPEVMQLLRSIEFVVPQDQGVRTVPSKEASPPGGRQ